MHLSRRGLFRLGVASTAALPVLGSAKPLLAAGPPAGTGLTPTQALSQLMAGNARFVAGSLSWPNQTPARRASLTSGQAPYATILGCADSRIPPEIVFDAGLGDLFVVRVAGNAPNSEIIGSIEYAVSSLQSPLVIVLGHSACGAVGAAVDRFVNGASLPAGHLASLIYDLAPAVEQVQAEPGDLVDNAVTRNVQLAVRTLSTQSSVLSSAVAGGTLVIAGARYDLASGSVTPVAALAA